MYVTRHKPPTCPECGGYLGGKWIPAAVSVEHQDTVVVVFITFYRRKKRYAFSPMHDK